MNKTLREKRKLFDTNQGSVSNSIFAKKDV